MDCKRGKPLSPCPGSTWRLDISVRPARVCRLMVTPPPRWYRPDACCCCRGGHVRSLVLAADVVVVAWPVGSGRDLLMGLGVQPPSGDAGGGVLRRLLGFICVLKSWAAMASPSCWDSMKGAWGLLLLSSLLLSSGSCVLVSLEPVQPIIVV